MVFDTKFYNLSCFCWVVFLPLSVCVCVCVCVYVCVSWTDHVRNEEVLLESRSRGIFYMK